MADDTISTPRKWDLESISDGVKRYLEENGHIPTATEFDDVDYLPSARQVQRAYGGVVTLRKVLGYGDQDLTKGDLRKMIAVESNRRGLSAEDYFEPLLIEKFGEPYVHVQKRYYKGSKNRYDFLVYARNVTFGVDIFSTDRAKYIEKNIRHKIARYKNAPESLKIYFVLIGAEFTSKDVDKAVGSLKELKKHPNMITLHESDFIKLMDSYNSLETPQELSTMEDLI